MNNELNKKDKVIKELRSDAELVSKDCDKFQK